MKKTDNPDNKVFKKNKEMVTRVIDDETILVPLFRSKEDLSAIYTLNEVAAGIWGLIDGKRNVGEIRQALFKKYAATQEKIKQDLEKYIQELKKIEAIF